MADPTSIALAPCPFCGESNAIIRPSMYKPTGAEVYGISCRTRRCRGAIWALGRELFPTEAEAIAAWNRRALSSAVERAAHNGLVAGSTPAERTTESVATEAALQPARAQTAGVAEYDAGLLSDYGGGNVEWWQDYIRAELARAHDHYTAQLADALAALGGEDG